MDDSLEARIITIEYIQEEFGHDIQEIKGQFVKLTKLIERQIRIMLENTCGSLSFSLQSTLHRPSHEPYIPVTSNIPLKVCRPNWQSHVPKSTITPTFGKVLRPINQVSSSKKYLEKSRMSQNQNQWDPIPITYTELLPRLLER